MTPCTSRAHVSKFVLQYQYVHCPSTVLLWNSYCSRWPSFPIHISHDQLHELQAWWFVLSICLVMHTVITGRQSNIMLMLCLLAVKFNSLILHYLLTNNGVYHSKSTLLCQSLNHVTSVTEWVCLHKINKCSLKSPNWFGRYSGDNIDEWLGQLNS